MPECKFCESCFSSQGLPNHEKCCDENPTKNTSVFSESGLKGAVSRYGPVKNFEVACHKCNEDFEVEEREEVFPNKEKYFCSTECARSFSTEAKREEINEKVSDTLTGRKLSKEHIQSIRNAYKDGRDCVEQISQKLKAYWKTEEGRKRKQRLRERMKNRTLPKETRKTIQEKLKNNPNAGGYRKGSGRGKQGSYSGIWCHSTWELAWIVYHYEHHIPFSRNWESFSYEWEGEIHKYIPDFKYTDNHYVEVKGYLSEKDRAKLRYFPYKIDVLEQPDMEDILEYVKRQHGDEFWNTLYN